MMKKFFTAVISIEETGAGILRENDCAVLLCGLERCLTLEEASHFGVGSISTGESSVFIAGEGLLYIDKRKNPDIILAVRTALCHGAQGVIIPFGNNRNRPYIREGRGYASEEMISAVREIKRLAPLFGREFCDLSAFLAE